MGQYLQMGICYRMEIDKEDVYKLNVTLEKVVNELNAYVDISLYNLNETKNKLIFEIKESIVLEQLQDFMQFQYLMYSQEKPYIDCFKSAVTHIDEVSSLKQIVELANKKQFLAFK